MGLFGSIIGGITSLVGGNKSAKASKKAAQLEYDSAMKGIAETARQFDATRADFAPYQALGVNAADNLGNLIGINGAEQQQSEIDMLRSSPLYKSLYGAGEETLLANASATGGLRGGNTQRSLADFGEDTLSSVIAQQLGNYSGLVGIGSGASGAVGNFGANAVAQQNALRGQGAGAMAQSALVRGGIASQNWQNAGTAIDDILGSILKGGGGSGGSGGGFNWKSLL